jgi:hypothetical protein
VCRPLGRRVIVAIIARGKGGASFLIVIDATSACSPAPSAGTFRAGNEAVSGSGAGSD